LGREGWVEIKGGEGVEGDVGVGGTVNDELGGFFLSGAKWCIPVCGHGGGGRVERVSGVVGGWAVRGGGGAVQRAGGFLVVTDLVARLGKSRRRGTVWGGWTGAR